MIEMIPTRHGLPEGVVDPKHLLVVIKVLVQLISEGALRGTGVGVDAKVECPTVGVEWVLIVLAGLNSRRKRDVFELR
jgi:hypothetical protein